MKNYQNIIKAEAMEVLGLHEAVHETFHRRDKDRETWQKACEEFHSYISKIESFIDRVYQEQEYVDQELIEFVISYLEVDPFYFRSGYIKDEMLRKIKRSPLVKGQKGRLLSVLHDAVENRGAREYKAYCRLAKVIADKKLIGTLETTVKYGEEGAFKSRAKLMLQYIENHVHKTKIC